MKEFELSKKIETHLSLVTYTTMTNSAIMNNSSNEMMVYPEVDYADTWEKDNTMRVRERNYSKSSYDDEKIINKFKYQPMDIDDKSNIEINKRASKLFLEKINPSEEKKARSELFKSNRSKYFKLKSKTEKIKRKKINKHRRTIHSFDYEPEPQFVKEKNSHHKAEPKHMLAPKLAPKHMLDLELELEPEPEPEIPIPLHVKYANEFAMSTGGVNIEEKSNSSEFHWSNLMKHSCEDLRKWDNILFEKAIEIKENIVRQNNIFTNIQKYRSQISYAKRAQDLNLQSDPYYF